jgi:hypothetical protein
MSSYCVIVNPHDGPSWAKDNTVVRRGSGSGSKNKNKKEINASALLAKWTGKEKQYKRNMQKKYRKQSRDNKALKAFLDEMAKSGTVASAATDTLRVGPISAAAAASAPVTK